MFFTMILLLFYGNHSICEETLMSIEISVSQYFFTFTVQFVRHRPPDA